MEQMQIYEHEQFGKIRTLTKDGDTLLYQLKVNSRITCQMFLPSRPSF